MTVRRTGPSLLFLLLLLFVRSYTQERDRTFTDLYRGYRAADSLYFRALHLSESKRLDDATEERLNRQALDAYLSLLARTPAHPRYDSLRFFASVKTAELEHYSDSLGPALHYYEQAIRLKEGLPHLPDSFVFKPLLFAGNISFNLNENDSAVYFFKRAEAIQDRAGRPLAESERLYNDLGVLYYRAGNYIQAKNYFKKSISQLSPRHPYYADLLVNYTINYASALSKGGLYDSAAAIYRSLLPYGQHRNELYNNIGLMYLYARRPQAALRSFAQVRYANRMAVGLQTDRARAWLASGRYDSAETSLRQAFADNRTYNPRNTSVDYGLALKTWGDLLRRRGRTAEALAAYQQSLHQFYPAYSDTDPSRNPSGFSGAFSYLHLFEALVAKAEAFRSLYQHPADTAWGRKALDAYRSAFALIDYIERTYDSDEARLFLAGTRYQVHDQPVALALQLNADTHDAAYLEAAYIFDQQNKGSVLAYREQENGSGVSSELRARETKVKAAIAQLSLRALQQYDDTSAALLDEQVREREMELGRIEEAIAAANKNVSKKIPSVRALQDSLLDAHTQLLSYHLYDTALAVCSITRTSFTYRRSIIDTAFFPALRRYLSALRSGEEGNRKDAELLSETLLPDVTDAGIRRLIIVPDDELCYLPFEALPWKNGYLVEGCSVQYQYSTALLKAQAQDLEGASVLSFAPFTDRSFEQGDVRFGRLPMSAEEAEGREFTGAAATKARFLEEVGRFDIVHLATHAVADDSLHPLSYIAFAPWQTRDYALYTQEIYNLSLSHNRLIILSACETAQGRLVRGEGVMSLSRAFAYAGCANIVTSLWKADDLSTAFITKRFHAYLSAGASIDEALRSAKIDFLHNRGINPRLKAPAYWAHLVFVGNYRPEGRSVPYATIAVVVLALGLMIFLGRRLFSRQP